MVKITYISQDGDTYTLDAEPGASLMQLATSEGIPGIIGECGGVLSCATCHVYVDGAWVKYLKPPSQAERDMLSFAEAPTKTSRLCCQIKVSKDLDGLTVRIPEEQ